MTGSPLSSPSGVRLAELLAVLSLGADLGMGQPMEHAMRQCLIALRLGDRLGLKRDERASLYYVSLIAWVGCHIDAYEQAKWFGDDLVLRGDFRLRDMTGMAPLAFMASHLGAGKPLLERARMGARFLVNGHREVDDMLANHWYAADALAEHLGLGQEVRATLFQTFERWDGKGVPSGSQGDEILPAARIVNLADVLEVFYRTAGEDGAVAVARERRGTQFAPDVVDLVVAEAGLLFSNLDGVTSWDAVIAAEPGLAQPLTERELDSALEALADFTDIKSPFTLGHSRGVADLAVGGARMQLPHLVLGQLLAQADRSQARHLRHLERRQRHAPHPGRQISELITDLRRHLLPVVAARHQQHQRQRSRRIGHGAGDQQRRRIAPVHVLQHDQQRCQLRGPGERLDHRRRHQFTVRARRASPPLLPRQRQPHAP